MKVHVLTLFPRLFENFLQESIVGIARDKGRLDVELVDWRRYATDRHRTVDDRPFGGGPGMVLKPEPIFAAVEDVLSRSADPGMRKVLLTPQGRTLGQADVEALAATDEWLVLCGRYEGFDERVHRGFDWDEVSVGPYVLSGGEVPAMALIEASARLLPGVLGDEESARQDSFADAEGRLDHPHWTRPREFRGESVPDVLIHGHHEQIAAWRRSESDRRTASWKSRNPPR